MKNGKINDIYERLQEVGVLLERIHLVGVARRVFDLAEEIDRTYRTDGPVMKRFHTLMEEGDLDEAWATADRLKSPDLKAMAFRKLADAHRLRNN